MVWEYMQLEEEDGWVDAWDLNQLAEEGWELVSVVTMLRPIRSVTECESESVEEGMCETSHENDFVCVAYLKREKPPEEPWVSPYGSGPIGPLP